MLRTWARRGAAVLVSFAAVIAVSVSFSVPASAANNCHTNSQGQVVCDVEVEVPGGPGSETPGTGPADFTPGPTTCTYTPKEGEPREVPCSKDGGWWANDIQCYWTLDDPQRPAPTGRDASVGAWYSCLPIEPADCGGRLCYGTSVWRETPPPGVNRYTPAQAAGMLARTFVLKPIEIGMAPEQKVHTDDPAGTAPYRRTWVGIPVWLWVSPPTESTWGPISRTATYGGVTVSGTASVQSLTWTSGDGQTRSCGAGTRFDAAAMANQAAVDSPTCGFRYQHQSDGGTFTLSATSTWAVEWTGGGQSGRIAMPTTSTSTTVRVGELQSVNVSQDGDTFGG